MLAQMRITACACTLITILVASFSAAAEQYEDLIRKHAGVYALPHELVHRVIKRESRYNPLAVNKGNYGIMQIRLGTARAMGYSGDAEGLLDPDINMTYAVKYLAGAYRAAGCDPDRAMRLYSTGYYTEAKRLGFSPYTLAPTKPENRQSSRSTEPMVVSAEQDQTPSTGAIAIEKKPGQPSTEAVPVSDCVR